MPVIAEILVKTTLFLGAAWVAHVLLRRANPRWRVLLWRGAAVGLLTIPVLRASLPELSVHIALSPGASAYDTYSRPLRLGPGPQKLSPVETPIPLRHEPGGPAAAAPSITPQRPSALLLSWARKHAIWFILAGWSLVASVPAARFCLGWRRIRRIIKSAAPAPPALGNVCDEIAGALGIVRHLQVRLSDEISSPFLTGLRRPLLILPCRMAESASSVELRAILAHELSHLRSNDLPWGYLLHWLSIVLWFHPLAWRIRPAHASACEGVSDAIAADFVGDVGGYSRTLARVALKLACRARAAVGIPMARVSDITRRLKALKRRVFPAPLARSTVLISLLSGLLATGLLGCLRLDYTESGEPGALEVLVIDDNDPDYENPPFDDTLYLVGAKGKVIKTISGFNTCESVGAERTLALANDGSPVVCELAAHKMSKYDPDGNLVFSLDRLDAVDISGNGDLYCLLSSGTIHGDSVLIIDPVSGEAKKRAEYGGIDLVVDDKNDSVWIVGANIKRLNRNLEEVFTIDPVAWCAVSVDYASDGSAWVAERGLFLHGGSKDRLLNVSLDGKLLRRIDLGYCPFCVAVNRQNGDVWVAGTRGLYKYNEKGKESRISRGGAFCVRVNPRDRSVWVAGRNLRKYSAEGKLLSTVRLFRESQKFIAVRKSGGKESDGREANAQAAGFPVSSPPEQEPRPTATRVGEERGRIRGVVLNADTGEPVAGAQVAVGHHLSEDEIRRIREGGVEGNLQMTAETDEKGRFILEDLAFRDYHRFNVKRQGFVPHEEWIALRKDKPEIDINVRLKRAAALTVKVLNAEGMPMLGQVVRVESRDGHALLPAQGEWRPELPYSTQTAKMGACSFEGLPAGDCSIEAMSFGLSETTHLGVTPTVTVKGGETKEVELRALDNRSVVKVKVEKDPHVASRWAALVMVTRNPGLLAWAGRCFYHPEDSRLARVMQYSLNTITADSPNDSRFGEALMSDSPYTFRNFPPGAYGVLALTWGDYKWQDKNYNAVCIRGVSVEISVGKEQTVVIPWAEPEGPSPLNPRVLDNKVKLEAREYGGQELCDLIVKAVGAGDVSPWGSQDKVVADASIRDEKVAFPTGEISLWDLVERTYLLKRWRLEADFDAERLVFRPST